MLAVGTVPHYPRVFLYDRSFSDSWHVLSLADHGSGNQDYWQSICTAFWHWQLILLYCVNVGFFVHAFCCCCWVCLLKVVMNGLPGAMGKEVAAACIRRGMKLAPVRVPFAATSRQAHICAYF